jgi:hypothetical protein
LRHLVLAQYLLLTQVRFKVYETQLRAQFTDNNKLCLQARSVNCPGSKQSVEFSLSFDQTIPGCHRPGLHIVKQLRRLPRLLGR